MTSEPDKNQPELEEAQVPSPESRQDVEVLPPQVEQAIRHEVEGALIARRSSFSGPMPPPDVLERYEAVVPGAAKDIVEEFKANGKHTREMTQRGLDGAINADRRSQWMASSLVFLGFVLIYALASTGHDWVAGVVAGTLLVAVITGFLTGKSSKTELESNDDE